MNFWDYNFADFSVWGTFHLIGVLLITMLFTDVIKRAVKPLRESLIPTSVLGGLVLFAISGIYTASTGRQLFNEPFFGGNGMAGLEIITYHALALGFIATAFKSGAGKLSRKRQNEIFNTGVTTVSTYLLQGVLGMGITIVAALIVTDFFAASGILLPFGYGQGPGQALNFGKAYQTEHGFDGGSSFGLTVAALGFLSASLGGVIHLNILKRKQKMPEYRENVEVYTSEEIQTDEEIPMNGSMDKTTVQIALIGLAYMITYLVMFGLGKLLPGQRATVYGFNFLFGVLSATLIKVIMNGLRKKKIMKKQLTNNFILTRISNCFFDVMVIASIAAIRLEALKRYWIILLILGVVGAVSTYFYNRYVARKLFGEYAEEQFLAMYGMLTGTVSTGIILLREADRDFKTPAADNLVYQNFPAIVFGFPMMMLATLAPVKPKTTLLILVLFFLVMNIILFRVQIFKRKKKSKETDKK